ncbi:MAG: hypothetical protein V4673_18015, partial [Pseudomonadota bacterium]
MGASTSFVIPVTPTLAAGASVINSATVSGGGDPTCPANARCTSSVTTPVNAAQLTMTKTASAASFTVGTAASYTLQVSNTGSAATTAAATITDTIPTGLTIGTLPAGCSAAGQTVTCTIPAGLAAGANASFVIQVTPTAAATPSVSNTATVSGGGDPTCPANARCTSSVTTPVNGAQLTLTKTASAANFTIGVAASYTLSVQNTGSSATTAPATIVDTIPTGLTIGTLPAGCTAAGQTVTCTIASGLAVNATSSFTIPVTPTPAVAASVTNSATVSGGGDPACPAAARCTSSVTTPVTAAVIDAVDDTGTVANGATGGTAVPNVLVNDTLNGNPATLATVTLSQVSTSNPNVTLDPATGAVNVAAGTPAGTYTLVYRICETLNPTNCDNATVTVTVGAAAIDAVDDSFGPVVGASGGTTPSVIVNDTLNGAAAIIGTNVSLAPGASPNAGLTMNADGTITIAAGTAAGTYLYPYTICELLNPTNCDTAIATVTVTAAIIDAVDDSGTVANGATGGTAVPNVLVNDTLNGNPATLATVTLSQVSTSNPNVTLDPATGAVNVAAGTPAGTYTLVYRICETLNPTNCDNATVTVTVGAAAIDAVDDSFGPVVGASGGTTPSVIVNDTLNGAAAIIGTNVSLAPGASPNAGLTMNADGTITIAAGTAAGTYLYPYTICELLNPTNCDTAIATVVVTAAVIDAVDDSFAPIGGQVGGTTPSVIVNDTLNGVPAVIGTNVSLTPGTAPTPTGGSITMNPDGTITIAPGTTAGTYTYPYTICELLNPANCDTAIATVIVAENPALIIDKTAGTPSGNTAGSTIAYTFLVTNTGNVTLTGIVVNDAQLDAAAVCAVTTLAPGASTTCTGTHTITQAEVNAGVVNNSATATGTTPGGGTTTSPPDTTSTPIAANPALTIDKTAGTPSGNTAGSTIAYTFLVTNTGNVTLTGIVINDANLDAAAVCPVTTLAPGASTTCTGTHTITQAEVNAGVVNNSATATGTTPGGGTTTSPPDTTSTPIAA